MELSVEVTELKQRVADQSKELDGLKAEGAGEQIQSPPASLQIGALEEGGAGGTGAVVPQLPVSLPMFKEEHLGEEDDGVVRSIMAKMETMMDRKMELLESRLAERFLSVNASKKRSLTRSLAPSLGRESCLGETEDPSSSDGGGDSWMVVDQAQELPWAKVIGRKAKRKDSVALPLSGGGGARLVRSSPRLAG